jgi:hypothetical protein
MSVFSQFPKDLRSPPGLFTRAQCLEWQCGAPPAAQVREGRCAPAWGPEGGKQEGTLIAALREAIHQCPIHQLVESGTATRTGRSGDVEIGVVVVVVVERKRSSKVKSGSCRMGF